MPAGELRTALNLYHETKDQDNFTVYLEWEKDGKAADADKIHRVVDVLTRVMKRRS